MSLCPDERLLFVRMISAMLRRSGGDAGAVMFEAYRHIVDSIGQRNSYVKTWGCGGFLNETNIYSRGKSLCF